MIIRKATLEDYTEIRRVYNTAKQYMDASGNPNQWKVGHPPKETLEKDISKGQLYVAEEEGIWGVFAFIPGIDPTYLQIEGAWLREAPYAAIHRIASDGTHPGLVRLAAEYCRKHISTGTDLRIDTHEDNKTMQHVLEKNGFLPCGIIHLENGDPRIAYQWVNRE